MITIALALSGALLAPAANSGGAITHGTFDQSDVVRIGRSLESVAPKHPDYTYPVRFRVVDKDEINAVSYFFFEEDEDELHPAIDIYQGLIDKVVGDNEGILAAVIAHELGHIALGHSVSGVMTDPELTDADNIYQREQELEADIAGASYLERSGRSKEAMIDLIKEFDRLDREVGWGWFETLASDHPSAIARAAAVDDDPRVWNAILSFDTGLAFLESRRWALAGRAFQEAIVKEPRLLGAVVNDAYASLMIYWDLLPLGVRAKWFRPDFGAFLTDPLAAARGDEVTDEDRRRYAAAMQKLERAIEKAPDVKRAKELLALAKILEPDGKESVIRAGLTELESLLTSEESRYRKVAIVNNLLVGYHRIEDLNKGFNLLIDTINATIVDDKIVFNSAAVENLVYITWQNASEETERTVLALFGHWLKNTSDASSAWDAARERYEELCEKLDVEPKETEPALLFFCRPVSIFIEGKQIALFRPQSEAIDLLGKPDLNIPLSRRYPDLREFRWKGGDIRVVTERGDIMRLVTYSPGSYLRLLPEDEAVSGHIDIRVGMTIGEFDAIFPLLAVYDPGFVPLSSTFLEREEWLFFESLNFGVLMDAGKITALTVTPIRGG